MTEFVKKVCDEQLGKNNRIPRQNLPWWTKVLATRRVVAKARWRKYSDLTEANIASYKIARNNFTWEVRKAKLQIWREHATTQAIRSRLWVSIIKWLIKGRRLDILHSSVWLPDGSLTTTLKKMANSTLDGLILLSPTDAPIPSLDSLSTPPTYTGSSGDLENVVRSQKNSTPEDDGITIRIIKKAWPAIGQSLVTLFTDYVRSSQFLTIWESVHVVVLLKSPKRDPAAI